MDDIARLKEIIAESDNIVFFGGAGVSTESDIPDFRSDNGVFNMKYRYAPETILSRTFFDAKTDDFYEFYRDVMLYPNAKPNDAHRALAALEQMGKLKAVITQNIDGLHQLAGSKNVFELHGSVHRNYCMRCNRFYDLEFIVKGEGVPKCECGGVVKPDVVLYEEPLNMRVMEGAIDAIRKADVMIIGGTSLNVYPAAGLIDYFRGRELVLINKSETPGDRMATLCIHDSIGKVLKAAAEI